MWDTSQDPMKGLWMVKIKKYASIKFRFFKINEKKIDKFANIFCVLLFNNVRRKHAANRATIKS